MIEFLTENWRVIAVLGAILVELILILVFKKRPQIIDDSFIYHVSVWIIEAEKLFTVGKEKLAYVLSKAKEYLGKNYNEDTVTNIVEWILTVPEKKGDK